MVSEKRVYEPLRNELNIEWHQNKINTIFNWFDIILVTFISIFIIVFSIPEYPDYRWTIIYIIIFIPIFLILILLRCDIPKRVGIFNNGIVFDYHGKYEYLYWIDVNNYYEFSSPVFQPIIKKKDGSNKYLNLVDKKINVIIRRKIIEHYRKSRYGY